MSPLAGPISMPYTRTTKVLIRFSFLSTILDKNSGSLS